MSSFRTLKQSMSQAARDARREAGLKESGPLALEPLLSSLRCGAMPFTHSIAVDLPTQYLGSVLPASTPDARFWILYTPYETRRSQRSIIAHELGHVILSSPSPRNFWDDPHA